MSLSDYSAYLVYAVPLLGVTLWHVRARTRREAESAELIREVRESGLTEPPSLHPVIDPVKCCGSGACATACPEGAIGFVAGKAVLANPSACIGHGACASACPVQAISLVFGTERRGVDIPMVKPTFETNVEGLFIAGELGGMGLIRKSAEQGKQAMGFIAKRARGEAPLDVVIVGAGPAGLAASLAAQERKLRYVTLEQETDIGGSILHFPRRKIAMTAPVKLPLVGRALMNEISKEELIRFWKGVVKRFGLPVRFGERLVDIAPDGSGGFRVQTTRESYRARSVLLALGRRGTPRKLGSPGEDLEKVVYRLLDPEQYRGQPVLVVGGGDSALEAALTLAAEPGTDVVLSYRGEAFNRVKPKNRKGLEEAAAAGRLRVMLDSTVARIEPKHVVLKHKEREIRVANEAVVVCAGGELPTPFLKKVGIMVETHHGETA
ncbi:MAG TPA: NAD(P)-binding domain-containing protein [Usitatibacteraceae bacterium]|nr:NAD(P)-binding domain-containing protein [Usitatibacteraceae bacterium]